MFACSFHRPQERMAATPESATSTHTVDSSIFFGTDLGPRSCPSTASPKQASQDVSSPASEQDRLLRDFERSIGAGGRSALGTSLTPTPTSPAQVAGAPPRSPYRCARPGLAWRRERWPRFLLIFSLGDAASPAARPLTSSLLCAFFTSETTQAASERRAAVAARLAARERQPSRSLSSSSHKSRKLLTCHACGTESRLA